MDANVCVKQLADEKYHMLKALNMVIVAMVVAATISWFSMLEHRQKQVPEPVQIDWKSSPQARQIERNTSAGMDYELQHIYVAH